MGTLSSMLRRSHQAGDLPAAEEAHQVVFQGQVEARGTGVALAGGAPAQLVVDAAGLVALGADDVQPAQLAHLFHLVHVLEESAHLLLIDAVILGGHLDAAQRAVRDWSCRRRRARRASTRLASPRISSSSSPPSLMSTPRPAMLVAMVTAPNAPARR